jgi:hypothetical protein
MRPARKENMATLIQHNGKETSLLPADLKRGFTLEELYFIIYCQTVQAVQLADGRTMWMDEEAKVRGGVHFVNEKATKLLAEAGGLPGDEVIGHVLITEPGEVK